MNSQWGGERGLGSVAFELSVIQPKEENEMDRLKPFVIRHLNSDCQ